LGSRYGGGDDDDDDDDDDQGKGTSVRVLDLREKTGFFSDAVIVLLSVTAKDPLAT
jgi:hypothetical protein